MVRAQPRLEARGFRRRQDQDLVLGDIELRLDLDAVLLLLVAADVHRATRLRRRRRQRLVRPHHRARVLLPVLDEPRRAERVGVLEHVLRQRLDVLLVQHDRHRNHHREVRERSLVVVLHRQHGPRAFAHQHDLRRVREHLVARAADVEATERMRVGRLRSDHERRDAQPEPEAIHDALRRAATTPSESSTSARSAPMPKPIALPPGGLAKPGCFCASFL